MQLHDPRMTRLEPRDSFCLMLCAGVRQHAPVGK
jgi:hypothetical protein